MFIVGIDIAKRSHEAIIIAEDGQVVRKAFSFRNNCTGYNLLLEQVRRLTLVKSQIVFAMESTAHYWLALYARLLKDGYTVMVLNPIQSHSLRELYIRKAINLVFTGFPYYGIYILSHSRTLIHVSHKRFF